MERDILYQCDNCSSEVSLNDVHCGHCGSVLSDRVDRFAQPVHKVAGKLEVKDINVDTVWIQTSKFDRVIVKKKDIPKLIKVLNRLKR